MIRESVAILALSFIMIIILIRSKHLGYALAVIPVGAIPAADLIAIGAMYLTGGVLFGVRAAVVTAFVDVIAIVLNCAFIMLFSKKIKSLKTQKLYLVAMLGYTVILGWVYIWDSLKVIIV